MKSVNWQNGQRIIKQVLDWFSSAKDQNDQEYRQDMTQPGIVVGSLNELDIIVGANNTPATPSITVRTGVAYDSVGERIYVSDETLSYDATNPSDTTDDGRGILLPTPHSTGSKNVPLVINSFNYIWINYLQTTDETLFTLQTATNAKQFYKKDNGYTITVTTVFTPPTASSVFIGSVNLTGFGVVSGSTIDTSGHTISLIKENRVKIKTPLSNLSDATTTYGFNQEHTLDEHIKAVGSGPVTPQNPHGITLVDIGVDVENVVANHQKYMHNNGMIGSKVSILSSLYTEFHPITPGDDFVIVKKLTSSEVVNIDGITITSTDIPSDITFLFNSLVDVSGTYYIYLDKFTKSLTRTTINPASDVTKYPVASLLWTAGVPALYDGNITSIVDLRVFGTINNDKIDNKDEYDMVSVRVEDGLVGSPALRWQTDLTTGLYLSAPGVISFASSGVLSANISGGQVSAVTGTNLLPSYSFLLDTNTGIYNPSSGVIAFTSNGVLSANISGGQITAVDGLASLPAYSFLSNPNTGIYSGGTNVIGVSTNGLQIAEFTTTGLSVIRGGAGLSKFIGLTNTSNTSPVEHATFTASVGGASAGDPYMYFNISGVTNWAVGVDNSDADKFKIANNYEFVGAAEYFILDTSGNITTQSQFRSSNGSAVSPTYTFSDDTNTGMYSSVDEQIAFSTAGTARVFIDSSYLTASSVSGISNVSGLVGTPSYTFNGDTGTGIWQAAAGRIDFSNLGTNTVTIDSGGTTTFIESIREKNGSIASPSYTFTNATTTGLYKTASANQMGFTSNSTAVWETDSSIGFRPTPDNTYNLGDSTHRWSSVYGSVLRGFSASNQLVLGNSNTTTISATAPSASRIYTVTDVGTNANFVLTEGTQTINGLKTLSSALALSATTNQLILGTTNTVTITSTAPSASRTYTIPDVGTNANFVLTSTGGQSLFPSANTPGAPAISFIGDTNTGIYNVGADILGFSTNSVEQLRISTTAVQSALPYYMPNGSSSAPALAFTISPNTGFYYTAANQIFASSGGTNVARFNTSGIQTVDNGFRFISDANFGLRLGGTTLTLSTSGHANPFEILSNGIMNFNGQPGFCAINSSDDSLTTAGSVIQFDSERFDIRSNYNSGTSTFTAPEFGYYMFAVTVYYTLGTANVSKAIELITTLHSYVIPGEFTSAAGAITGTVIAVMNAGNTAQCILRLGAGSVTIQGNDSFGTTVFSGWKIG